MRPLGPHSVGSGPQRLPAALRPLGDSHLGLLPGALLCSLRLAPSMTSRMSYQARPSQLRCPHVNEEGTWTPCPAQPPLNDPSQATTSLPNRRDPRRVPSQHAKPRVLAGKPATARLTSLHPACLTAPGDLIAQLISASNFDPRRMESCGPSLLRRLFWFT